ncbi:MAG: hypothetical protein IT422_00870 [Pirellulaceae bacterium]|nr:hypothetical protein [Pirellulaceae bacterium]
MGIVNLTPAQRWASLRAGLFGYPPGTRSLVHYGQLDSIAHFTPFEAAGYRTVC